MVSLLVAFACAPAPPARLPATRDPEKLERAIHNLAAADVAALRPTIERWARVGARATRPEGILSDLVGHTAARKLETEPEAIPTLVSLLYGRNEWQVARALVALGERGCVALVAAARPGHPAVEGMLVYDRACVPQLDAADTAPARELRAMREEVKP